MKEYLVLHALYTIVSAILATVGWNAGVISARENIHRKHGKKLSDAAANAYVAASVLFVTLLPEVLLMMVVFRRLRHR